MKRFGLSVVAVVIALAIGGSGGLALAQKGPGGNVFPAGDTLYVSWGVESSDSTYRVVRVDEYGDSLVFKLRMTTETDGRDIAILGPYAGLRANAWQFMGEHMGFFCAIRDTAMHERFEVGGGDGADFECTDSSFTIERNDAVLRHDAFIRNYVVGAAGDHDTLHVSLERDFLWRLRDAYALVRWKIKSNEADIAVAGGECRGQATVPAAGDTVQVTCAYATADSTLSLINLYEVGPTGDPGWVGSPKVLSRWDGGFTVKSSGDETLAVHCNYDVTRLGHEGDTCRVVLYFDPAMGYASSLHDVGYLPEYGEVRRDKFWTGAHGGAFAAMLNIGSTLAPGDTIADGSSSYMDADSLKKSFGATAEQWMVSFVAINPASDVNVDLVAFDDSSDFATYFPYDSTYTIADTTSYLQGTTRYMIFRSEPVYLTGEWQTFEYAVGMGKLLEGTSPVHPVFPKIVFMGGEPFEAAGTRRIWHE